MYFDVDEYETLTKRGTYIVDFWIGNVHPDLASVAKELGIKKFYEVKVGQDDNPEVCKHCNVTYVPTLILMRAGKEVSRIVGYKYEK